MNQKKSTTILLVEDEKIVARDIQNILTKQDYSVVDIVSSGDEAIQKARKYTPDIVLMDIKLNGNIDGIESARQIRNRFNIPVIFLTAYADESTLQRAKLSEPYGYILKPFSNRDLYTSIEMALYKHSMEKKLQESERWYATLLNSIGEAVITTDTDGVITFINPVAEKITMLPPKEIIGKPFHDVLKIVLSESDSSFIDPLANDFCNTNDALLVSTSGTKIPITFTKTFLKDENNNILGAVLAFQDITERKRAEYELAAEKERLSVTLRSIADAVITTDTAGDIILLNKVAEEITGWTQANASGKNVSQVLKTKSQNGINNPILHLIKNSKTIVRSDDITLIAGDGREIFISCSGAPIHDRSNKLIGMVIVFSDISEKRKFEKERLKVQKLESIGILAGGIAHDFNNVLTAIIGNLSLAKLDLSPQNEMFEILSEAEKASQRARHLTNQLLTFSRGGAPIKKITSISKTITEAADFALSGSSIKGHYYIDQDLKQVNADTSQIGQVIQNIVINSVQAMPDGGNVEMKAENVHLSDKSSIPLPTGEYIKIAVIDQGVGIQEDHLTKIFDPYFSTKQLGSGLGLATAYSIIKKHGGHITVSSESGKGATLTFYLPVASESNASNQPWFEAGRVDKGKILVMDDEEFVIKPLLRMLHSLGFETDVALNGEQAIEKYQADMGTTNPFNLVILDLTIQGGMGGKETITELRKLDPYVKAIVTSGYSNDPVMSNYHEFGFSGVIAKPYKIDEISSIIQQTLKKH